MTELLSLTPGELKEWCLEQGMPGFRAGQLFAWLHKGARFAEMTNLPKPLREQLQADCAAQVIEACPDSRVDEAAVIDVLNGGKKDVQHPCENPQEDAERAADGKIGVAAKKLPRLVLQGVQELCVSGPPESAFREAPFIRVH